MAGRWREGGRNTPCKQDGHRCDAMTRADALVPLVVLDHVVQPEELAAFHKAHAVLAKENFDVHIRFPPRGDGEGVCTGFLHACAHEEGSSRLPNHALRGLFAVNGAVVPGLHSNAQRCGGTGEYHPTITAGGVLARHCEHTTTKTVAKPFTRRWGQRLTWQQRPDRRLSRHRNDRARVRGGGGAGSWRGAHLLAELVLFVFLLEPGRADGEVHVLILKRGHGGVCAWRHQRLWLRHGRVRRCGLATDEVGTGEPGWSRRTQASPRTAQRRFPKQRCTRAHVIASARRGGRVLVDEHVTGE